MWVKNMFHFIPFTAFVITTFSFFFKTSAEAFRAACPVFIVNFWDLSEIELAQKDLSFQICDGCKPEYCYTTVCNCTMSVGGGGKILKLTGLLNATSVVAAGNFKLGNHCQTNMRYQVMHKIFIMLLSDQLYPRWHGVYESHNIILYNDIIVPEVDVLLFLQRHSHLRGSAASSAETFC